jgi:WD40 repeat protein
MLVTGSGPGNTFCHVLEIPSGAEIARFQGHSTVGLAAACSPVGTGVATGGGDQHEIYLWDPSDVGMVRKLVGAGQPVWSVGFSGDGGSIAFGNEHKRAAQNDLGPLQKTLRFEKDAGLSLSGRIETGTQ